MGRPAWQLSREVKWGDLWPSWYAGGNRRRHPVIDPDSREARLRNQVAKEAREAAERAGVEAAMRSYGFDGNDGGDSSPPRS